jgi:phage terminase large subunit
MDGMARKPTKPNREQRRFAWFLVRLGIGAEAVRRAGYTRRDPEDYGSKLLRKPHVLILALQLDERRRLRRLPVAVDAVKSLSSGIRAVIDRQRGSPEQLQELVRHYERLGSLPPETEAAPMLPVTTLPLLQLTPVFEPLRHPARYKGAYGGRGSGKSHVLAELLVRRCVETAPLRAVCIREVQRSLDQSVKRLVEDKIQALGAGGHFRVQAERILGPQGGRIIFQGMQNHTAESIKSLEGYDIAWVEEAQSLSARSLELLRPTIRKKGSELWFSWNPTRPKDPVDVLFRGPVPPPDAVLVPVKWSDNPHFPAVLLAEMEWDRQRDPDKYQHVWLGGYRTVSEARVFKNWRVETFETPADAQFLFGADWGFARDPTVLVRCFVQGRTLFVDHEAYQVGCEIDRTPALFDTIPEARTWPIIADSARPETISYMQRNGFGNITGAIKGAGSVEEGVAFLQNHDILVHPRCRHLIDELALYSYRTDRHTGELQPRLEDRENHAIDALRYAIEGLRHSTYDTSMRWVGTLG